MTSSTTRGYTLLEMIVAIGLFSIVMFIVTGAYLTIVDLDRKARSSNELVANLAFAVDSMARAVRTGSLYGCNSTGGATGGTNGTCSEISFMDGYLNSKVGFRLKADGTIGRCLYSVSTCTVDGNFDSLTDPRIKIATTTAPLGLTFYVRGVGTGDGVQPQITFTIKGTMPSGNKANDTSIFYIQTSATQRLIDI